MTSSNVSGLAIQAMKLGDDTWIVVGKLKGIRVSLGIDAPKDIAIRRGELGQSQDEPNSPDPEPDCKGHGNIRVASPTWPHASDNLTIYGQAITRRSVLIWPV